MADSNEDPTTTEPATSTEPVAPPAGSSGIRYAALLDALVVDGRLTRPWRDAFDAVPRHWFVPDVVYIRQGGRYHVLHRERDPLSWWELVNSDREVVTQLDDGKPDGPGEPSSWVAAPSVVAAMLRDLGARPGDNALEIGTGTGWTAALLAYRLGTGRVTTTEVDLTVTGWARRALTRCETQPEVLWHDGERGWGRNAPYDRVVSGCAVRRVPEAWVRQARVGATILAPLHQPHGRQPWVRLVVREDRIAQGPFTGVARTLLTRRQRLLTTNVPVRGEARGSSTKVDVASTARPGFLLFAAARVPWLRLRLVRAAGGPQAWVYDQLGSGATAALGGTVEQYGPARLWDRVEEVWEEWHRLGRPRLRDFGLTVSPHAQQIWLRHPARTVDAMPTDPTDPHPWRLA